MLHYAALAHCQYDIFAYLIAKGTPVNKGKGTTALKLYLVMNKPADPRITTLFLENGFTKLDLYLVNKLKA